MTLSIVAISAAIIAFTAVFAWRARRQRATVIFIGLGVTLLVLTGGAAAQDSQSRDYLAIQEQYQRDHPVTPPAATLDIKVQQAFPAFPAAKVGDTYKTERCISCHVPDVGTLTPQIAADRLASDFFKYEPNAQAIANRDGLKSTATKSAHPTQVDAGYYQSYGSTAAFIPYQPASAAAPAKLPGPLPDFLDPKTNGGKPYTLDQLGCIVCHNGSRLSLDEQHAHQNLIVNPEYDWTAGAALYYKNCVSCHGALGEGGQGPPLSNQDRLGFFNEDYYYRCIEYGYTGFEHVGSLMPAWGSAASDWTYDPARDKQGPKVTRQLSEDQIHILQEFIRHWQNYQTLP
jgi:mono/diheme cytochrome c family protein